MNDAELARLVVHCRRSLFEVYVGRPSDWGNPYSHKEGTLAKFKVDTVEDAIEKYEEWLLAQPDLVARVKRELKGKVLGCWCRPSALCHGDILAKIANR